MHNFLVYVYYWSSWPLSLCLFILWLYKVCQKEIIVLEPLSFLNCCSKIKWKDDVKPLCSRIRRQNGWSGLNILCQDVNNHITLEMCHIAASTPVMTDRYHFTYLISLWLIDWANSCPMNSLNLNQIDYYKWETLQRLDRPQKFRDVHKRLATWNWSVKTCLTKRLLTGWGDFYRSFQLL